MNELVLIFGSYFNAISVSRHFIDGVCRYVDSAYGLCHKSEVSICDKSIEGVRRCLNSYGKDQVGLYVISCSDDWCDILSECIDEFPDIAFFMSRDFSRLSQKDVQTKISTVVKVPVPAAYSYQELLGSKVEFPVIVKPVSDAKIRSINRKNLVVESRSDFSKYENQLESECDSLIISEIIESDVDGVYSYACYKKSDGKILNEWVGKKNIQYPGAYGVFAACEMGSHQLVLEYGRLLAGALDYSGFIQPEFKICRKRGKPYLMEVNLRPMMWHSVALLNGVNIYKGFVPDRLLAKGTFKKRKLYFFPHVIFLLFFGSMTERQVALKVLLDRQYYDISFSSSSKFNYLANIFKVMVSGVVKKIR